MGFSSEEDRLKMPAVLLLFDYFQFDCNLTSNVSNSKAGKVAQP